MTERLRFRVEPRDVPPSKAELDRARKALRNYPRGQRLWMFPEALRGELAACLPRARIRAMSGERVDPRSRNRKVYFIRCQDAVKIGIAIHPEDRLKSLQTAHPRHLELIGFFQAGHATESALHKLFADYLIRGEWFELSAPIKDFIRRHCVLEEGVQL